MSRSGVSELRKKQGGGSKEGLQGGGEESLEEKLLSSPFLRCPYLGGEGGQN